MFVPWDKTEERGASISSLIFARGGEFWSCGHLLSFNPKYLEYLRFPVEAQDAPP